MKKLLLIISLFASIESFASPWNIMPVHKHVRTLPNVLYTDAYVWNKAYTPSGKDELVMFMDFDDYTGNYTSHAVISIYGYYRHTQLGWPQVYWQWEYRQFNMDIPPGSHECSMRYVLQVGETFDMSTMPIANGQGLWLNSGVSLISFTN